MFKLSKSKGQWFILSAVIATGAFLTISVIFRSFFSIDTADVAKLNQDFYLDALQDGLNRTLHESECINLERNLNDFLYFNKAKMSEKGYLFDMRYDLVGCNIDLHLIMISSSSMDVWEGNRPVVNDTTQTGAFTVDIELNNTMPYVVNGNANLYDSTGFRETANFTLDGVDTTEITYLSSIPINGFIVITGHLFRGDDTFFI